MLLTRNAEVVDSSRKRRLELQRASIRIDRLFRATAIRERCAEAIPKLKVLPRRQYFLPFALSDRTYHRPNAKRGDPAIPRALEFSRLVVEHTKTDLYVCIDDAGRDLIARQRQVRFCQSLVRLPWVRDIVRLGIEDVDVNVG